MAHKAMTQSSDSLNPSALSPLKCSADERPPVFLTYDALIDLQEEVNQARRKWYDALRKVPTKQGPRRTAALARVAQTQKRYEDLVGHAAGKPSQNWSIDLPPLNDQDD